MAIKVHGQQRCGANTKFEQDFSLLPKGQFTETRRALVSVVVAAALVFSSIVSIVWYFVPSPETLSSYLPTDTTFYASLALPAENRWYERPFFWRQDVLPPVAYPLYQKLGLMNLSFVDLSFGQVLPLVRDKLELAMLPDGTWIFAADLKFKPDASILAREFLWKQNLKDLHWTTANGRLYLSNQADFWEKIKVKPKRPLGHINRHLGRGAASIYLKNSSPLAELGLPTLVSAGNFLTYPFILMAKTSSQGLIWQEFGAKRPLSSRALALPIAAPPLEAALVWQFADLGAIINKALSYFSQENKELLGKFYNFNPVDIASKFADKQGLFVLSDIAGPNWILLIRENGQTGPNQEILEILKDLAASFFAITHPQTVEHQLVDGSKMLELKAERSDIVGQSFIKEFQGEDYEFWGLLGQGENIGYFVGFLQGQGYVLTVNLRLLNVLPTVFSGQNQSISREKDCFKGKKMAQAAWLTPKSVVNERLGGESIKFVGMGETVAGKLAGCVIF